jgi:glycine/D-amino acid oxidase-like deaminating enzyme
LAQHNNYWFNTYAPKNRISSGLVKNADVVIIGGGIAGLSTASALVAGGIKNVYIVEESDVAYHASGRSSGQMMMRGSMPFSDCHKELGWKKTEEYIKFVHLNNRLIKRTFAHREQETDFQYTGGLRLAMDDEELLKLQDEVELIRKADISTVPEMLSQDHVTSLMNSDKFVGGAFISHEGTLNPYRISNMIANELGNIIFVNSHVESVEKSDDKLLVSIKNKGIIRSNFVVYCTNAYTPRLLPELAENLSSFRGQMISTNALPESALPNMSMSCDYGRQYLRLHNKRLLLGGMRHEVRGQQANLMTDGEFSQTVYNKLRSFLSETFPRLECKIIDTWTGIMCATSDNLPLIGPVPGRPGEFINAGFNGYGYSQVFLGGIIIKDYIKNNKTSIIGADLFTPERLK